MIASLWCRLGPPRTCAARKCSAGTPPDRLAGLRHPVGQASKNPLASPASRIRSPQASAKPRARLPPVPSFAIASRLRGPVPPGQRIKARSPAVTYMARVARPGKTPPGLRRKNRPAAAVLLPARSPFTHPHRRAAIPALPRAPCPIPQKPGRFVHLAFPGGTAAAVPAVVTRPTRIRALEFGLSGRVDRAILQRRQKAPGSTAFPGLASRSAPGLSRRLLPCVSHNAALCKRALLQG